jgi:hypothetical protein
MICRICLRLIHDKKAATIGGASVHEGCKKSLIDRKKKGTKCPKAN